MHAVLGMATCGLALSKHAPTWAMAVCVFGGGLVRPPKPNVTPDDSLSTPPSSTQLFGVMVVSQRSMEKVPAPVSARRRARVKAAAARIFANVTLLERLRASPATR